MLKSIFELYILDETEGDSMKKIGILCLAFCTAACVQYKSVGKYQLEKLPGYEVPVCVNYSGVVRDNSTWIDIGGQDRNKEETLDTKNMEKRIVSYSYCLEKLPKQVHLVEKKEKDMTICYDRNNKVELPILYCQKDINIYQTIYR